MSSIVQFHSLNGLDTSTNNTFHQPLSPFRGAYSSIPGTRKLPTLVILNQSAAYIHFTLNGSNREFFLGPNGATDPIPLENTDSSIDGVIYSGTTGGNSAIPNQVKFIAYAATDRPINIHEGFSLWQGVPDAVYDVNIYGAKGDGITDDSAPINHALSDAKNNGGGTILFRSENYFIGSNLTVDSDNITLLGTGLGAQIICGIANGTMINITGPGGAGNFRYGIRIINLFINGNNLAGVVGVDLFSVYDAVLMNCRFRYINGINIHFDGVSGAFGAYNYVVNCHITDSTGVGIQTDSSEWLEIEGCHFGGFNNAGAGIAVSLRNLNCKINGSLFDHNDISILLQFAGRNIIEGCQFDRGATNYIILHGCDNCIITDNLFAADNRTTGIDMILVNDAGTNGNIIANNNAVPGGGWTNFINESVVIAGSNVPNIYTNNQMGSYGVVRSTGIGGIFKNNYSHNPRGFNVTQPAVPASTVAVTNTTGYDCTVFINANGSGLSAVAIGGVNIGFVPQTIRLPALQTITLTYPGPGAPIWNWYGD